MREYKHLSGSDRLSRYRSLQKGESLRSVAIDRSKSQCNLSGGGKEKTPEIHLPDTAWLEEVNIGARKIA